MEVRPSSLCPNLNTSLGSQGTWLGPVPPSIRSHLSLKTRNITFRDGSMLTHIRKGVPHEKANRAIWTIPAGLVNVMENAFKSQYYRYRSSDSVR
jgi:hypothetical protein